jgi:hypothetical protein
MAACCVKHTRNQSVIVWRQPLPGLSTLYRHAGHPRQQRWLQHPQGPTRIHPRRRAQPARHQPHLCLPPVPALLRHARGVRRRQRRADVVSGRRAAGDEERQRLRHDKRRAGLVSKGSQCAGRTGTKHGQSAAAARPLCAHPGTLSHTWVLAALIAHSSTTCFGYRRTNLPHDCHTCTCMQRQ